MASFELAIPTVLENEGGYVNNPNDPGGETMFGISKRSYPRLDIKNLTRDEAIEIYRTDFWKFDGVNDQCLATKIFDSYVNMGHTAIKLLQRLLGQAQDGAWGPNTQAAVNSRIPELLLQNYRDALVQHYQDIVDANPAEHVFLVGWLIRARQ
jgi:lysozyme family protein